MTQRPGGRPRNGESGQGILEFFVAALVAMVMILGVLQIGMLFNAHSMVKLAAFHAARAAIVARDADPTRPVTLEEMRRKARLAAFLTLIPVIPEGFVPANLSDFTQFFSMAGIQKLGRTALEYLCCQGIPVYPDQPANAGRSNFIDVKFLPVTASDVSADEIAAPGDTVEFDDPARSSSPGGDGDPNDPNLVKVVVTWQYPLVIPIANRILIAAVRPFTYGAALVAAGANPLLAGQTVLFRDNVERMPVWALGASLDRIFTLDNLFRYTWRIPVRGSYVMRMQWDRRAS